MRLRSIAAVIAVISNLLVAAPALAQAVSVPADAAASPLSMPEAIKKGRAMLQALLDERAKSRPSPFRVPNANSANVSIAVWDRDTDAIEIMHARKTGDELVRTSGADLPVRVTYSAKLYSTYALPSETNAVVVGVIYPVVTKTVTKKATTYMANEVVYTPYQQSFYTPEMLAAGSDYLSFLIQDAYDELDAKGVKSRAYPDRPVTEVVDPYLVKSIAVIEHSDVHSLTKAEDQDRAIGKFLVKLAINGEAAFGGAVSTAGARGMVQFIPSTYALMVAKRPDLGLIPDFAKGMADHQNAVKAQVAYIDMDLASMPMAKAAYEKSRQTAAEFLAASYNGGQTRVRRAWNAYGTNWAMSWADQQAAQKAAGNRVPLAVVQANSLRNETAGYVAKLKHAYGMFAAGYFATPNAPSGALPAQVAAVAAAAADNVAPPPVEIAAGSVICFGDGGCVTAN